MEHLRALNNYCGLIKECGVVVVAAHCMFCLRANAPLAERFAQFSDVFTLHEHIKDHLAREHAPKVGPHLLCEDELTLESEFWKHVTEVHGIPPSGPRRITRKLKTPDSDNSKD